MRKQTKQTLPEPTEERGLYTMTIACQLTGLSPRTLRIYEEEGLIRPFRRSEGAQRLYSNQDITWIRCIRELVHEHGLTTTAIRRLLDLIPCWEVKRCSAEQARLCAPGLNIPNLATGKDSGLVEPVAAALPAAGEEAIAVPLEFKLFFGIAEFGTILSCTRCIQAERIIRRLAARHNIEVDVQKYDILSPEADRLGIILTPTILLNGKIISAGKALSAAKLEEIILANCI
jgi:MerR family transcriptional regulator, heat shock protein HspR